MFIHLLPYMDLFSASSNFASDVFLHDIQDGLEITVDALQPHPAAAIRTKAALSLQSDNLCKGCIFLWPAQAMDETIVSVFGYLKEAAHNRYSFVCR